MESDKFDSLVRGAYTGASRRGVVRVGIGALAASAFATLGLGLDDTDAKKKKKKKKKKKPVAICPADLPVACGDGCCPSDYSLCCVGSFGEQGGGGGAPLRAAGDSTCNPPSFTCCSVDQGGGSCGGGFSKCCPATTQAPFGSCAEADATCCPSTAGGFSCRAEEPVCCAGGPANPFSFDYCCLTGETCCQEDADCPGGGAGSCADGCCAAGPREAGRGGGRSRQGNAERFHMAAR